MKQWLPSIIAFAGAGLTIFSPALQSYVAGHPSVAMVVTLLYAVVTHVMPSPVSQGSGDGIPKA
jgi:hypothetical protein